MGQDVVGHHDTIQELYVQVESLENRQRQNNIRLRKLKEKAEGANVQAYVTDRWKV